MQRLWRGKNVDIVVFLAGILRFGLTEANASVYHVQLSDKLTSGQFVVI